MDSTVRARRRGVVLAVIAAACTLLVLAVVVSLVVRGRSLAVAQGTRTP